MNLGASPIQREVGGMSLMKVSNNTIWAILAVAVGAGLVVALLPPARSRRRLGAAESTRVDEASEDSFPASDPPSFSGPAVAVPGPTL
jgi:hypothetical protein